MLCIFGDLYLIAIFVFHSALFIGISAKMIDEQRKEPASQKYKRKVKENPEFHEDHLHRERNRDEKWRENVKETEGRLKFENTGQNHIKRVPFRKQLREAKIKQTGTYQILHSSYTGKGSGKGESFTPPKTKLPYSNIYSNSNDKYSTDESLTTS